MMHVGQFVQLKKEFAHSYIFVPSRIVCNKKYRIERILTATVVEIYESGRNHQIHTDYLEPATGSFADWYREHK